MKKVLKNKKGFTLVELLAVIVILALIMGIAVVAMSGVVGESQKNAARKTAANIIDGVRTKLTLEGELRSGTYYFDKAILEKGGVTSPLGGDYKYGTSSDGTKVADGVYKAASVVNTCKSSSTSYVTIEVTNGAPTVYTICLASGVNYDYINGTENDILADKDDVIKTATAD